ncbi:hypothetical protein SynMVIR181_01743 [Synechococcus sp. MVIR-18-1]|nr:hypothetical protein SynMVIR181_01743 [Synechococcus sp. MVIR-18-1]
MALRGGCRMLTPVQDGAVSHRWLALSDVFPHHTPPAASMGPLKGFA